MISVDISRIIKRLFSSIWIILLVTVISTVAGFFYTFQLLPDIYVSNVTLVGAANGSYSNSVGNIYIMRNYSGLVKSEKIARRVIQSLPAYKLDISAVQAMVGVSYNKSEESALFYISARNSDQTVAIAVANAAADAFVSELKNVTGTDAAVIVDQASTASIDFSGSNHQVVVRLEFAGAGFLLAVVIISILELFSKRASQIKDCSLNGTIDVLGVIPRYDIA